MNTPTFSRLLLTGAVLAGLASGCRLDRLTDPNNPSLESATDAPGKGKLDQVAAGTFASMRTDADGIVWYYQITGVIGREIYIMSSSDPRYVVPLGVGEFNNNNFLSTRYFNTYSAARRTARLLAQGAQNAPLITDAQRNGYLALANTAEAYDMLVLSDLLYQNGLRVEVDDPLKPGKIQPYPVVLAEIKKRLDAGADELAKAGPTLPFALPPGYGVGEAGLDFTTPAGFLKFNRALAARLAVRAAALPGGSYQDALVAVRASFLDPAAPMTAGPRFDYGVVNPDVVNPLYQVPNSNGGSVIAAHPSFLRDIRPGDTRASKVARRTPISALGQFSDSEPVLYPSNGSPVPIIKNEELLLIAAEANLKLGNRAAAIASLNTVAQAYGLSYAPPAAATAGDILNEILYQRRYSLYYEGQRWVDLRRLSKLSQLNAPGTNAPEKLTDGTQTTIVQQLPTPYSEIAWDQANP